ncbi:protein UL19 [Saimiriine betaherpesvirus 4]|uniref:Protein UL19 n=1 Tax=Saimiriine betaherpesvirus 4 TaxID=1535247 RepID=G8XSS9_9BETA|nr:protein UL19 [Saimiriine betaherpesvirus 4]AEV80876.1 protein UL19 [Saimiriine betaherpesvirus 4]
MTDTLYSFFERRLPYPPRNVTLFISARLHHGPSCWEHLTSMSADERRTLFVFGHGRIRLERYRITEVQCTDVLKMKRVRSPSSWIASESYPDLNLNYHLDQNF